MMQQVYNPRLPRMITISDLRERISDCFLNLDPALCRSWTMEFNKRLRLIIRENGGQIEQFVNKV
jgi:hypothetical protein